MDTQIPFYNMGNNSFIAGHDLSWLVCKRLYKMRSTVILFCHQGRGSVDIDLKTYTLVENSIIILLPDSMFSFREMSRDFFSSYFICSPAMFWETAFRLDTQFFHFLKTHPVYHFPPERTGSAEGLLKASAAIYADRDNRYRYQIAKNLLHNFLLDTCDKTYRLYSQKEIEGFNRRTELFRRFIDLVHTHCALQREVMFYADTLCISTKYLTDICRWTTGNSAKKIIDNFVILEIKIRLQSTDLPLQQITDQLNFPDQSYLGRYFKRHEGLSPLEYRKQFAK